jgi:hypothetical protein
MPPIRVRHAIAAAGLLGGLLGPAGSAGALAANGPGQYDYGASRIGDARSFGEPDVYGLVGPGAFGPNLLVATELPEPITLALLAVTMAAGAYVRGRRPIKR